MDVTAIVSSLGTITELGKLIVNERDRQKAAAIQIELTNKITEVQAQLLQVLGTVIEQQRLIPVLEQRIRDMEAAQTEKGRYQLAKIGSRGQFFAYKLRAGAEPDEGVADVDYFICQPCFDAGKKVVLTGNGSGYWHCSVCKHGASTEDIDSIYSVPRRRTFDDF